MPDQLLTNAEVSIKGKSRDGRDIEITGAIKDMHWRLERDYDDAGSYPDYYERYRFVSNETYSLDFKPDDEGKYMHMQIEGTEVEKFARVRAKANTVAGLERARVLAGAPEHAEVVMWPNPRLTGPADEPSAVEVEFRWKETKY